MKKAIKAASFVLGSALLAKWLKLDPAFFLIVMIAFWVFMGRLEKEDEK